MQTDAVVLSSPRPAPRAGAVRDPLAVWRAARARPHEASIVDEHPPARVTLRRLARYVADHDARARFAPLPAFERDPLRQGDAHALGLADDPRCERLDREARAEAEALWRALRARPYDEPWVERWLLYAIGFTDAADSLPFWREVLDRPARSPHEAFAFERRTCALAALASLTASHGDGPPRAALLAALAHPETDVRASAAVYLVAAHRLQGRALPLDALSALDRLAREDPSLEPRHVARALLESDGVPARMEQPGGVYVLRAGARVLELRCAQTLGQLHVAIVRAAGREQDAPYAFQLSGDPRATRYAVRSDSTARFPGEVLLGELGLRAGDRFFHRLEGEGPEAIDVLELRPDAARDVPYPRVVDATRAAARRPWPVPVLQTYVAGTRFHDASRVAAQLVRGAWLALRREPANAFDDRAIGIFTRDGASLGYVPRVRNRALAAMMDAGEPLAAYIDAVDARADPPQVYVVVVARGA